MGPRWELLVAIMITMNSAFMAFMVDISVRLAKKPDEPAPSAAPRSDHGARFSARVATSCPK